MAASLAAHKVAPNAISLSSIVFALGAGAALGSTSLIGSPWTRLAWVLAAGLIQLRLLANMLDGMVAQVSGRSSPIGELYNELPDRVSDSAILIGAGYAIGGLPSLGYVAAIMALFVTYLRATGAALGAGQAFHGPMAKPHRMFVLTVACLFNGLAPIAWQPLEARTGIGLIGIGLGVIILGGVVTAYRRLRFVAVALRGTAA
ncbi:MAG: CDP-alcohol phosphatidyltransferase family protein [Phycisphaerales bacterium]|nr:CDP-alcohol phosphatidyltransferase family protein [Phycisphaerales bacterium]